MGFSSAALAYIAAGSAAVGAAATAYSVLNRPKPPQLPAPTPQPTPLDQQQAVQQQSLAAQIARRGRASTVLTNQPDQAKLGS